VKRGVGKMECFRQKNSKKKQNSGWEIRRRKNDFNVAGFLVDPKKFLPKRHVDEREKWRIRLGLNPCYHYQ